MAELKTKETKASVSAFLKKIPDKSRRDDCLAVVEIMRAATGEEPRMWGTSIVGFGVRRYQYAGGREGEWMVIGFSPRKSDLTLYMLGCDAVPELMPQLGKYKVKGSCLHVKRLTDVDLNVLKKIVNASVKRLADQRIHR